MLSQPAEIVNISRCLCENSRQLRRAQHAKEEQRVRWLRVTRTNQQIEW